MTESASVAGLSAEVRILHVGNGQITPSMYRQLDEVNLERFEAFGRVKDNKLKSGEGVLKLVGRDTKTGALVRYDAQPPPADWPTRPGPPEFSHWLLHTQTHAQKYVRFSHTVTEGPDGRGVVWTVSSNANCLSRYGWHVTQDRPPGSRFGEICLGAPSSNRKSAAP
jgi:hypothetical protein